MTGVQARATLTDVARLAGVSAKTVSRVYTHPAAVTDATRERVLEAASRLRFKPNTLARDLRLGGMTRTVGFITAEFTNPFYIQVAAGIEQECSLHGYTMVLAASDDPGREQQVIDALVSQRVRAVLLVPIGDDYSFLEGERQHGTAIVAIDRPARNLLADSVLLANREGGYLAAAELVRHGHRRIAYVCNPASVHTQVERLAGFRQALAEAGIAEAADLEARADDPAVTLESLVAGLLESPDPPTAIVGGNNRATIAAIRELRRRGTELALVGFDEFEMADALDISVIAHDPMEMGRQAARLALHRLEDPTGHTREVIMGVHYVARGSGERPPA